MTRERHIRKRDKLLSLSFVLLEESQRNGFISMIHIKTGKNVFYISFRTEKGEIDIEKLKRFFSSLIVNINIIYKIDFLNKLDKRIKKFYLYEKTENILCSIIDGIERGEDKK